ncbi:MAG: Asp-tRNA(Asn)/Glu-tRNA(Gln) amidotransferase subunit GatA [Elusimicrobiota bacterium]
MIDTKKCSVQEIVDNVKTNKVSPSEVVGTYLARVKDTNPKLNAFVEVFEDSISSRVKELESKLADNPKTLGALAGVPIAIKDNIAIKGKLCTCASKIMQGYVSPYNAEIINRLVAADAILVGRTNMDEFAMGSSTETSFYGITRNPWDLDSIPGGSSGGSAAAVASKMVPLAIGSDTGGSIRQPASCCGISGLKPTYGLVSRYGLFAFASSLDQIGPFANSIPDLALLLNVIAGHDTKDSTSVDMQTPDYVDAIQKSGDVIKGLKIGLPKEYFISGIDKEVETSVRNAVKVLESLGAEVVEVSLPHTEYALAVYYIIAPAEASANLARYDGIRFGYRSKDAADLLELYEKSRGDGFGPEVKRRIMLGTYTLSSGYYDAYYLKAQKVRTLLRQDFENAFKQVDVIITPTCPTAAFKIGAKMDDPLQMYLSDIFTISCNLAGIPGLNIPCGFSGNGLPIGMQVFGKHFDEVKVLQTAYAYEQHRGWAFPGMKV